MQRTPTHLPFPFSFCHCHLHRPLAQAEKACAH